MTQEGREALETLSKIMTMEKHYQLRISKLETELSELRKFRQFIPVLKSMEIKDPRMLERRLKHKNMKVVGLINIKENGTKHQKKSLSMLEKGTTQKKLCDEIYNNYSKNSVTKLYSVLKNLRKAGIIIYSMGHGEDKKYQLQPFKEIHIPATPEIPRIEVEKHKDYDKLLNLFKMLRSTGEVYRGGISRSTLVKNYGEEELDRLMEMLFKKGLAGAKNREGKVFYFTKSSKYEFDAAMLTKKIYGVNKDKVSMRILAFLKQNPGCTNKEIAKAIYGRDGIREQKRVSICFFQSLKGAIRKKRGKGRKVYYYADGEVE